MQTQAYLEEDIPMLRYFFLDGRKGEHGSWCLSHSLLLSLIDSLTCLLVD